MRFFQKYSTELKGAAIFWILGVLPSFFVKSNLGWYATLKKPDLTPPNWIFGPVWTVLYIMMGVAGAKLWKKRIKFSYEIALLGENFLLNLAWPILFFAFQWMGIALIDLALLWFSLLVLLIRVRHQKLIFFLLVPYILWASFALFLNFSFYMAN